MGISFFSFGQQKTVLGIFIEAESEEDSVAVMKIVNNFMGVVGEIEEFHNLMSDSEILSEVPLKVIKLKKELRKELKKSIKRLGKKGGTSAAEIQKETNRLRKLVDEKTFELLFITAKVMSRSCDCGEEMESQVKGMKKLLDAEYKGGEYPKCVRSELKTLRDAILSPPQKDGTFKI